MTSELAKTARAIQNLPGKERLRALIDHPRAEEIVRRQPAEDLYVAIADVGLADATDIVQLASPDQFRTFLDLAGWRRDRVDPQAVLTWLRAARGEEPESFVEKLDALDLELLEVTLRELTTIYDLEEDPDANPEGPTLETAERRYLIELKVEGVEEAALRHLLSDMMARDPFQFTRLVEALRWELTSELEETAFRFRTARLEDLGFPPLEKALELFTLVKVPSFAESARPGAALADPRAQVPWLERVARELAAEERETWEKELRYLVNSALVAEAADAGDLGAVRRVSEMARDYLSLGLEHLTGGDPARAVEVVRATPSLRIFQVGFSTTLALKHQAEAWLKSLGRPVALLPFESATLAAIRRKRPLRALRVEGAEPVPFRSRKELLESAELLERAKAQDALLSRRFPSLNEPAELERALLRFAIGAALGSTPTRETLGGLTQALFQGEAHAPTLRAEGKQRVVAALLEGVSDAGERAEATRLADEALRRLLSELAQGLLSGRAPGVEVVSLLGL